MQRDKGVKADSIEDTFMANMRLREKRATPIDSYEGAMSKKPPSRKRDLRKVQEWLEAKRRAEALKRENGED